MFNLFIPIAKVDDERRVVYGPATTTAWDSQGDSFEWDGIVKALDGYRDWGNVREMHGDRAVGVAVEYSVDPVAKAVELGAHIVDDAAWAKVKAGVYKGFSVGGVARLTEKAVRKQVDGTEAPGRIIKEWDWVETSLVDRPANPEARFTLFKRDGQVEPVAVEAAEGTASPEERAPATDQLTKGDNAHTEAVKGAVATLRNVIIAKLSNGCERGEVAGLLSAWESLDWWAEGERYRDDMGMAKGDLLAAWNEGTVRAALGDARDRVAAAVIAKAEESFGGTYTMAEDGTIQKQEAAPDIAAIVKGALAEGLAPITERLTAIESAQEPIAKVDFATFAKAEDVTSIGERLAKVESALTPGGPHLGGGVTPVTKGHEAVPGDTDVDPAAVELAKVDLALASATNDAERQRLGQERAAILLKATFKPRA